MERPRFKIFFLICFFLLINLISGYVHYNLRLSEKFGDEVFHFYGGHLILNGIKLYQQAQVNHQPIPHLLSAFTEIFFPQNNLYTFIACHREIVFIYAFFWNLINFIFFGKIALIIMAIFEPLKFYFQGYKNLQETLVAYPLIFLICDTLLLLKFKNKDNYFRKIFFSVALFFAIFSMLPTWFACILVFILRLVHTKTDKKILFLPFLTLFFLLGLVIPYKDYLIETIYNNIFFLLPNSGYTLNLVNIILMPFGPFIPPYINQKIIFGLLILFLIYQVFLLIKKTKNFNIPILIIALLYLTNFLQVDDFKFSSFHLLPWVVSLITINIFLTIYF